MYCDFYSITNREKDIPVFVEMLVKEIEIIARNYEKVWVFDTIFFGGGTPSLMEPRWMEKIMNALETSFDISNVKEITMEANPGEAPMDSLIEFRKLGINRLSIGFQSLQPQLLTFLSRIHRSEDCLTTFRNARDAGFENINIDMIYNIPRQSLEMWQTDLKQIIELAPNHICAYSLTVETNTTLHAQVQHGNIHMPSDEIDLAMFEFCQKYLCHHNYEQYEISSYSKTNMECQHNLHYWKLEPYLAFGPSAHGYDGHVRWWNTSSLDEYVHMLKNNKRPMSGSEILSQSDHLNELIFNGLRTREGIQMHKMDEWDTTSQTIEYVLNKWDSQLDIGTDTIRLKKDAYKFADEIAIDLMHT